MRRRRFWSSGALALLLALFGADLALSAPAPATASEIARVDLATPFHTRSAWRLVATQGPAAVDGGGDAAPGALQLCFENGPAGPCTSDPSPMPPRQSGDIDGLWEPHYLSVAKPVYPQGRSAPPLLLIVTTSLHATNGSQAVSTQLFKYSRETDTFERVYPHETGTNNNEEVRFITRGPLEGSVISAESTSNAPYGYWIEVDRFTPGRTYRRVLRYRSATRYADGNSLAVIDSEMPNIEGRLGLWKPGSPLPLPTDPAKPCRSPRLDHGELWCERPR